MDGGPMNVVYLFCFLLLIVVCYQQKRLSLLEHEPELIPLPEEYEMDLAEFSRSNRERCQSAQGFNHPLDSWARADWFTAVMGELGEAANVAKKLRRIEQGLKGNAPGVTREELRAQLADELADTMIYLDLLAQSQGINLGDAVVSKFNRTSEKHGYPVKFG